MSPESQLQPKTRRLGYGEIAFQTHNGTNSKCTDTGTQAFLTLWEQCTDSLNWYPLDGTLKDDVLIKGTPTPSCFGRIDHSYVDFRSSSANFPVLLDALLGYPVYHERSPGI